MRETRAAGETICCVFKFSMRSVMASTKLSVPTKFESANSISFSTEGEVIVFFDIVIVSE